MKQNPTTDRKNLSRVLPEPVVLTQEETMKIAAGLAEAVNAVAITCCLACGRGGVSHVS
jgi:hypothetical protein